VSALIDSNGAHFQLGDTPVALFGTALGFVSVTADGRVRYGHAGADIKLPTGAVSAAFGKTVLVGGEDGSVYSVAATGDITALTPPLKKWIEQICLAPDGQFVVAAGRIVVLYAANGTEIHRWNYDGAVTGLALDPKGKRLAVSHYNGVSLWWINTPAGARVPLDWKGSHTSVIWSPDGKFVVTAMQELALHGWRVVDKANMRMAGYPSKTKSMAWTQKGKYLATSGAAPIVCWPFASKDGPMGKGPLEMPPASAALCTVVAAHPVKDFIAAGYDDGSVLLFRVDDQADLTLAVAADSPVACMAFSQDGKLLAFARDDGSAGYVSLP
jgi:WD40 repeat protein